MKKLIALSAIVLLGFTACKKEEVKLSTYVTYSVNCKSCQVTYNNEFGFSKTLNVTGQWDLVLANYEAKTAKLDIIKIQASPVLASISLSGYEVVKKFDFGTYEYTVN